MSFIVSPLSYLQLQRYINPTTWISDIVYCVYSVVFTTTTAVQKPPKSYLRQMYSGGENFVYTTAVRNRRNRTYARCTMAGKILYILQRFRNRWNRTYARCTMAGKILYILQRFRNPRHRNCDSCTMAETYRIYYSGTVYHPPSHLRRRKTNSGEDVMLAG